MRALQDEALKRFTTEHSLCDTAKRVKGVVPLAVARRIVETEFMTVLAHAPFDLPKTPRSHPSARAPPVPRGAATTVISSAI